MSVRIIGSQRDGSSDSNRSNSSGARIRTLRGTTFGSSVSVAGFVQDDPVPDRPLEVMTRRRFDIPQPARHQPCR